MDTMQAPAENLDAENVNNVEKVDDDKVDQAKIEAMVTPEQVLSANVARKRRNLTRKRTASVNRTREQTPLREVFDERTTTTDEDIPNQRPKTPERRRKKINKNVSKTTEIQGNVTKRSLSVPKTEISYEKPIEFEKIQKNVSKTTEIQTNVTKRSLSVPKTEISNEKPVELETTNKRHSLTDIAQYEMFALFDKAKRSLTATLTKDKNEKNNKKPLKRSHSTPRHAHHQLTKEELLESFKKAEEICSTNHRNVRKYSTDSVDEDVKTSSEPKPTKLKPFRPEVQQLVAQKKLQKQKSSKIVEILDPKTSKVVAVKTTGMPEIRFMDVITILRTHTILELCKSYKAYKKEMKREYDKIRCLRNKCIGELMLIMIFCGLGGILFKTVEGSFENFYKCGVKRIKRDFIETLWYRSHNLREDEWKSLARTKLRMFEEELHLAHEAGVHTYSGQRSWSFLNGIVYALTIITTIGYGHMYPTTTTGMALTIVYSIIGIPLFLIALTDFGKLFTRCIKFIWSFVRRVYYTGSCRKVRKTAHVQEIFKGAQMMYEIATFRRPSQFNADPENVVNQSPANTIGEETPTTPAPSTFEIDDEFNLPISVAIFILVLYIFSGALIYYVWEKWDFFASFYFVFISMSTIGFGDYVPRHPICMIVSIVYLVFGLALMSMCINVVQEKLSDTFKQASAKLGATIGFKVAEDDGSITTVPPEAIEVPDIHNPVPSKSSESHINNTSNE